MGRDTLILLVSSVIAITLHECSHGYVANFFGDPTAKNQGRLTLNPIAHIDPFGTVALPLLLRLVGLPAIGFAKPVPVDITKLRDIRNHSFLVSMAGPFTNVALCLLSIGICRATGVTKDELNWGDYGTWTEIAYFFGVFGLVNISLAIFNLFPIPPLDGSAIIERLLPRRHLGTYFRIREKALPLVMILLLVNSLTLHLGSGLYSRTFELFQQLAFSN
ncbi:MAG: site-2 protease family protein [Acidobacteria bacterium]|nr:site-2 protease family protein [Acidobacteriota bacterium]